MGCVLLKLPCLRPTHGPADLPAPGVRQVRVRVERGAVDGGDELAGLGAVARDLEKTIV